jgi:hypothetical protein
MARDAAARKSTRPQIARAGSAERFPVGVVRYGSELKQICSACENNGLRRARVRAPARRTAGARAVPALIPIRSYPAASR